MSLGGSLTERAANVSNNNQVDCQRLQFTEDGVFPDVIGNITVHLVEGNGRRCARRVTSHDKEIFQVKDARLGSMLGLLDHGTNVVHPSGPKSSPKRLSSSARESQPEPIILSEHRAKATGEG